MRRFALGLGAALIKNPLDGWKSIAFSSRFLNAQENDVV